MSSAYNLVHNNPEGINIALYSCHILLFGKFFERHIAESSFSFDPVFVVFGGDG